MKPATKQAKEPMYSTHTETQKQEATRSQDREVSLPVTRPFRTGTGKKYKKLCVDMRYGRIVEM